VAPKKKKLKINIWQIFSEKMENIVTKYFYSPCILAKILAKRKGG
jgi:hypothetical protein